MVKEKKKMKPVIFIIAAVVVLLLVSVGGILMFRNFVNIRNQHLNVYSYSTGGGMNGGYYSETIKREGDHAIISVVSAEWYAGDPKVSEYQADAAVLDEIESVVRKGKMNFWNHKKFTRIFIADGESKSYSFDFDENDISFSSQVYPMKYRNKLSELDPIVEKYIASARKLPGLVLEKKEEEESYLIPEGEQVIYVCSYAENDLKIRVLNGTDEEMVLSDDYQLILVDTGDVITQGETPYDHTFRGNSRDEMDIRLTDRLDSGNYKFIFGDLEIPFEIR